MPPRPDPPAPGTWCHLDQLLDTTQAATLVGVTPATIAVWRHRHQLTPAVLIPGRGRGGLVPLYRPADVYACHRLRARTRSG